MSNSTATRAEGVLTFATDGRQTLQGTLAADTLDLTPYVSTVKLLAANQREWNSGPIALDGLAGIDFDLRLSAAKVILSDAKLGRTAIGANLRGGHLAVTIGEAQAYGGVIKGSVALANFDQGVDVKSQLQFTDVDLESCLGQLFGLHRLEGKGNIAFAVEGAGDSVLGVTRTLNGTASLTGQNGAIAGFDVDELLRRLERRPLSGGGDFRTGRTPYDKIAVALKIAQGKVSVDDVKIDGPSVHLAMAGSASIPSRELDLTGTAALVEPPKAGHDAVCAALHRAGLLGRSDHAARRRGADPPLGRRRAAARRGARPARARCRPLGDRAADRRRPRATGATPAAEQTTAPAQKP